MKDEADHEIRVVEADAAGGEYPRKHKSRHTRGHVVCRYVKVKVFATRGSRLGVPIKIKTPRLAEMERVPHGPYPITRQSGPPKS